MRYEELVEGLARSGAAIASFYKGLDPEVARWKPAQDRWSLQEILGHMVDEETGDFGMRMRLTIESPEADWPPIDPDGWVVERRHNEKELGELLESFRSDRESSLAWLRGLDVAAMESTHTHPKFGSMQAGDLFAAWCAHDLLHLAQMARTRVAGVKAAAIPFDTDYAAP